MQTQQFKMRNRSTPVSERPGPVALSLEESRMRNTLYLSIVGLALAGFGLSLSSAELLAQPQAAKKPRMLMVTISKTFTHGPVKREKEQLAPAEVAVTQLGQTSGLFTVDCTQ